ncbi:MAG: hypothetical protein KF905_08475 [Flavobacteriales bacterium]|nr:hypothetical protein [Flavobacteriales bacterium]
MAKTLLPSLLTLLFLVSCGTRKADDLCKTFFEPYPDLISGRVVVAVHEPFLDGMALYREGEYQQALDLIRPYSFMKAANKASHLYVANCYLALGQPYDAELHLDHLRNTNLKDYADPVQWYTVICWLCSGQNDRALTGARGIATGRRHTYQKEAKDLVKALEALGK